MVRVVITLNDQHGICPVADQAEDKALFLVGPDLVADFLAAFQAHAIHIDVS
ncbi:hypothetical protein D3C86_1868810 [compost metagenome]